MSDIEDLFTSMWGAGTDPQYPLVYFISLSVIIIIIEPAVAGSIII
jgi:hypothetical protein